MPVDPTETAGAAWPCRTPEDVVLARTWRRTRALRRRRALPALAVVAMVVAGLVALPDPATPLRVATDGSGEPTEHPTEGDDGGDASGSSAPATTTTTQPPGDGPDRIVTLRPPPPPSHVVAPVVGPVPVFPREPVYSTSHPLLLDPEGDAWVQVEPARAQSDPTLDITRMDVTANATSVTTELRIVDLVGTPSASAHYGSPTLVRYVTTLQRPEGYFSFYVTRYIHDGSMTVEGMYWKANADTGAGPGAYGGTAVTGVTPTVDATSGTVRVTVGFADLNQVLATHGHQPWGTGTTVLPQGRTVAKYGTVPNMESGADGVAHSDPAYSYRMGD